MYKVTSEIYKETNFRPTKTENGKVISKFQFNYPTDNDSGKSSVAIHDNDGDLLVERRRVAAIDIEHSEATEIRLVGLQVWRGALLLADYLFHTRHELCSKQIMELGAGVGLTSIAAAIYAENIICTDVNIGGILNLIRANVERNKDIIKGNIQVMEYNFMQNSNDYSDELLGAIDSSDIIVAADVIYDDDLTDAFIRVIDFIFERQNVCGRRKTIYIALEKRYVFLLSECDAVAPMFEYFIRQTMSKPWQFDYVPLTFPQYFQYERCEQLLLIKLTHT